MHQSAYHFLFCELSYLSTYKGGHGVGQEQGDFDSAFRNQECRLTIKRLGINQAFMRNGQRGMPLLPVALKIQFKYILLWPPLPHATKLWNEKPLVNCICIWFILCLQIYLLSVIVRRLGLLCKLIVLDLKIQKASFAWNEAYLSSIAMFQVHN